MEDGNGWVPSAEELLQEAFLTLVRVAPLEPSEAAASITHPPAAFSSLPLPLSPPPLSCFSDHLLCQTAISGPSFKGTRRMNAALPIVIM